VLDYVPVSEATLSRWAELGRGQGTELFFFERQLDVLRYMGEPTGPPLDVFKTDPYVNTAYVSPASTGGRYHLLAIDDPGTSVLHLFDSQQKKGRAVDVFNVPGKWVSWSPDGTHALVTSSGEGLHRLLLVQLESGRTRELSRGGWTAPQALRSGLNQWGAAEEQVMLDGASVAWTDAQNYTLRLNVHCNQFVAPGCDYRTVLRTVSLACKLGDPRCHETRAGAP